MGERKWEVLDYGRPISRSSSMTGLELLAAEPLPDFVKPGLFGESLRKGLSWDGLHWEIAVQLPCLIFRDWYPV
jgi:hypothetical protein